MHVGTTIESDDQRTYAKHRSKKENHDEPDKMPEHHSPSHRRSLSIQ